MVRTLLVRGMLVGILAGALATLFAYLFGEQSIDLAIAFEDHAKSMAGEMPDPELVSRAIQSTLGLTVGVIVFGAALGGLYGIAVAFAQGRLGRLSPSATAVLIALAGFVVLVLVPQLKYPANPPSVGSPDTIRARTELYFVMLGMSLIVAVAAFATARSIAARHGVWLGNLSGGALYIVVMGITMAALPVINEVPNGFAADVLWNFRIASLGIGAVLWGTLGIGFGLISEWRPFRVTRRLAH